LDAYARKRQAGDEASLEASILYEPFLKVLDKYEVDEQHPWEGIAIQLLGELKTQTAEATIKAREWPKNARAVSNKMRRLAPHLLTIGIRIVFPGDIPEKQKGKRILRVLR